MLLSTATAIPGGNDDGKHGEFERRGQVPRRCSERRAAAVLAGIGVGWNPDVHPICRGGLMADLVVHIRDGRAARIADWNEGVRIEVSAGTCAVKPLPKEVHLELVGLVGEVKLKRVVARFRKLDHQVERDVSAANSFNLNDLLPRGELGSPLRIKAVWEERRRRMDRAADTPARRAASRRRRRKLTCPP